MLAAAGNRVEANASHSPRMLSVSRKMKAASRMSAPDNRTGFARQDVGADGGCRTTPSSATASKCAHSPKGSHAGWAQRKTEHEFASASGAIMSMATRYNRAGGRRPSQRFDRLWHAQRFHGAELTRETKHLVVQAQCPQCFNPRSKSPLLDLKV